MEGDTFAVTGATGLVGRQLVKLLIGRGDKVNVLTRDPARARETLGSFSQLGFYGKDEWMQGVDGSRVVVNLAGEPISTRWSEGVKKEIYDSRVLTTRLLSDLIRECEKKPEVFVSGSAIGYYGTSLGQTFSEQSPPGSDFLARVCQDWEEAAMRASSALKVFRNASMGVGSFASGFGAGSSLPALDFGLGFLVRASV